MQAAVQGRAARLAASLFARRDLVDAVRILNRQGILPMPLKGVLLQHVVYRDPAERILSDVDLLVPPGRFEAAVEALRAARYSLAPEGRAAVHAKGPSARLEVDLHRRLFSPGLFGLTARHLFERGRIDERLFDAVVVVPDAEDLYAHLVGNFAKGRHHGGDESQLRDLAAVASRMSLSPSSVARHLEAHGLARAARYALGFARATDPFAARVLARLAFDPVGELCSAGARAIAEGAGSSARASLIAPHLVNRSMSRGAASLAVHVALGLRRRLAR